MSGFLGQAIHLSSAPDGSQEWLDLRKTTIGGSDAGIILGVNQYQTAKDLWFSKREAENSLQGNPYVEMGICLEPFVKARLTGYASREGVFCHPDRRWQTANVDGVIESGFFQVSHGCEVKVTGGEWDEVPDTYFAQCQHYMMVTEIERWEIVNAIIKDCRKTLLEVWARFGDQGSPSGPDRGELFEAEFFEWIASRCELQSFMVDADSDFQARLLARETEYLEVMLGDEPPEEVVPDGEVILLENEAPDIFGLFHELCELDAEEKSLGAKELQKELSRLKSDLKVRLASLGSLKKVNVGPNSATWVGKANGGHWRFNLKGWS